MFTARFLLIFSLLVVVFSQHNFSFNSTTFLLDGQPIRILSGEMHYARIPPEYWSHRLKLAKAMGLNTIATYVFWNFHQKNEDGPFDFESLTHNLAHFLQLAKEEGLYVLLRPGPYTCAEWDFGGFPSWFLKHDDMKPRSYDIKYLSFVEKYFKRLAEIVVPFQITHKNNGPIIMVQIENEFGSFGDDHQYLLALKKLWVSLGINVPFYSADGGDFTMLSHGHIEGAALGMDPGNSDNAYDAAKKVDPNVVAFSSETYPGWLTHWGEQWASVSTEDIVSQIDYILRNGHSFNLYMLHGGTNWGFWAGANDGGHGYQPHITSYDYDAPITENGNITEKYLGLKKVISKYIPQENDIPDPPAPMPTIYIPKVQMKPFSDLWDLAKNKWFFNEYPQNFEVIGQFSGVMIYKTNISSDGGLLSIEGLRDYALVFADDSFVGVLDRSQAKFSINISNCSKIELVVEAMGRINFGYNLRDLKGIVGNVTLDGKLLNGWEMASFPLENIEEVLKKRNENNFRKVFKKQGIFYFGEFSLQEIGDSFIDVSNSWVKGVIYVNGNNLGRYWNIGPQFRLYCPRSFLKKGNNQIIILDLHYNNSSGFITGEQSLKKI